MYDKLVTKVKVIDNNGFLLKTQCNTDKSGLEKKIDDAGRKISDASGLVEKTKITEIEVKIPIITGLATTAALNAFENKIPDFRNLFKKTDYNAKISGIVSKYFTTSDYNRFTNEITDNEIKKGIS